MKVQKVGIATGINPFVAMKLKANLLAQASRQGQMIDIVEDDTTVRSDAPDEATLWADRRIAAYLAARNLLAQGAQVVLYPDVRLSSLASEVQKEVNAPVVSIFEAAFHNLRLKNVRKVALLGSATPAAYFKKAYPDFEFIEPTDALLQTFEVLQDPQTGLRAQGLTPAYEVQLLDAAHALLQMGAQCLIPNCGQIARFASLLQRADLPIIDLLERTAHHLLTQPLTPIEKPFKVGLIGGLGPAATVDLYNKITLATPAKIDQEHIKLVVEQNPQIPDRTEALLHDGDDPVLALYNCAYRLQQDGCDAIIVPCNTAHAFLPYLARHLSVPFINMQQAALDEIAATLGDQARIGLLATSGTIASGIYSQKAQSMGLPLFTPDATHQKRVMQAIYGDHGVKAGYTNGTCRDDLISAAEFLVKTYNCNCLILGCTELPLILSESKHFPLLDREVMIVDPTAALARKVVAIATNK